MENPMTFLSPSLIGQGKVNQLGGSYINGRPLNVTTRQAIVEMYLQGEKPCNISRRLKVSHGAVSKILCRYNQTGSIQPGQIGGTARTRKTIVQFSKEIIAMKTENPDIQPKEIRNTLIRNGLCTREDAPTESSIARKLTAFKREKVAKVKKEVMERQQAQAASVSPPPQTPHKIPHSIENILSCSNASQSNIPSHSSTSSALSSNDELYSDDEDGSSTSRSENRRNRTAFTTDQIKILERCFDSNMYPTEPQKQQILEATGLDLTKINTWFSNRRARVRKTCGLPADLPLPLPPTPSAVAPGPLPRFTSPSDLLPFLQNAAATALAAASSTPSSVTPPGSGVVPSLPTFFHPSTPLPAFLPFPLNPQQALLLFSKLQKHHLK